MIILTFPLPPTQNAVPYPPDPYLADSQYYSDYAWDHFHEFPFIYVQGKGKYSPVQSKGSSRLPIVRIALPNRIHT